MPVISTSPAVASLLTQKGHFFPSRWGYSYWGAAKWGVQYSIHTKPATVAAVSKAAVVIAYIRIATTPAVAAASGRTAAAFILHRVTALPKTISASTKSAKVIESKTVLAIPAVAASSGARAHQLPSRWGFSYWGYGYWWAPGAVSAIPATAQLSTASAKVTLHQIIRTSPASAGISAKFAGVFGALSLSTVPASSSAAGKVALVYPSIWGEARWGHGLWYYAEVLKTNPAVAASSTAYAAVAQPAIILTQRAQVAAAGFGAEIIASIPVPLRQVRRTSFIHHVIV